MIAITKQNVLIMILAAIFFTGCTDDYDEITATQPGEIEINSSSRMANGFQGKAYERLADGSIGPTISGVKITFTKEDGSATYTVYTNSYGSYKVTLPVARYRVVATHWNYDIYDSAPGFFVVNGSGYQTGNIFLKELNSGRSGFTYQRNWNNSIGPKIGYVKLTFTKDDGLYSKVLYSKSYGYYNVSLPPGKYYLKAEKQGYFTYTSNPGVSVVSEGNYSTLNFFLKKKLIFLPI